MNTSSTEPASPPASAGGISYFRSTLTFKDPLLKDRTEAGWQAMRLKSSSIRHFSPPVLPIESVRLRRNSSADTVAQQLGQRPCFRSHERSASVPTYVCSVPPRSLSDDQKDQIAAAIGRRHCEATGAPSFFVQVVIKESDTTRRYLGGELSGMHIWIRGDIRQAPQKRCAVRSCSPS